MINCVKFFFWVIKYIYIYIIIMTRVMLKKHRKVDSTSADITSTNVDANLDAKVDPKVDPNIKAIEAATVEFATRVTIDNNMDRNERAVWIDSIFAKDAYLRPTVGQVRRTKKSEPTTIKSYFRDYFSQSVIPSLSISNTNFHVVKLTDTMYSNYAYVEFKTDKDKFTAVMSFIFEQNDQDKKWYIKLLHSSPIYLSVPNELIYQGDVFPYWPLTGTYGSL